MSPSGFVLVFFCLKMETTTDPKGWIQTQVLKMPKRNFKSFNYRIWDTKPSANAFGGYAEMPTAEGKVIAANSGYVAVRHGTTSRFTIISASLFPSEYAVPDNTVRVIFPQRTDFDGLKIDGSEDPADDEGVRSFVIGAQHTFPVIWPERFSGRSAKQVQSWTGIQNPYLRDLITQLERLPTGTGRSIADLLVSITLGRPRFVDPAEDASVAENLRERPGIEFMLHTPLSGGAVGLGLRYNRAGDFYSVDEIYQDGRFETAHDDLYFDDIGAILSEHYGDKNWRNVKVELLKAAPKAKVKVDESCMAV